MNISLKDLKKLVITKLSRIYDAEDSQKIADVILYSELSGMGSHGIVRLVSGGYYDKLDPKRTGKPEVKSMADNVKFVDGKYNSGMLVLSIAVDEAIKLGEKNAVSLVGTNNTKSTSGYISYYLRKIAESGFIGIIFVRADASSTGFGAKYPLFGTNPVGFAFPGEPSFILDMGTSATTYGAMLKAKTLGKELPEGIAFDKDGNETTDPAKAIEGSILTFDKGYKGAGLAMSIEILAGILTGAGFGKGISSECFGNLIITIKPDVFVSKQEFSNNLKAYIDLIKSKNNNGRLPGENSLRIYNENIKKGYITVDDKIIEGITLV